jgi:hypothetical protein
MSREASEGERPPRRTAGGDEETVRARLEEIQRNKRERVRWNLSRHTAERALVAISDANPRPPYRRSSKSRRRKRRKRLL